MVFGRSSKKINSVSKTFFSKTEELFEACLMEQADLRSSAALDGTTKKRKEHDSDEENLFVHSDDMGSEGDLEDIFASLDVTEEEDLQELVLLMDCLRNFFKNSTSSSLFPSILLRRPELMLSFSNLISTLLTLQSKCSITLPGPISPQSLPISGPK